MASAWVLLGTAPLWQRLVIALFATVGTISLALDLAERQRAGGSRTARSSR
ncbi:hypothetical protein ACIA8O_39415 [Kitasatospora sp. NPDC051853]|uniref:hypothetical protein n=1 Tax=Kitasatospora sp. NPDC051853 TaxID=3364058 RepID=UPI003796BF1D